MVGRILTLLGSLVTLLLGAALLTLAASDLYVEVTELRHAGTPGVLTVETVEVTRRSCQAHGTFRPDAAGAAPLVAVVNECVAVGTQIQAQHVASLRDLVGLPVMVGEGAWGSLALFVVFVIVALGLTAGGGVWLAQSLRSAHRTVLLASGLPRTPSPPGRASTSRWRGWSRIPAGASALLPWNLDRDTVGDFAAPAEAARSLAVSAGTVCVRYSERHVHYGRDGTASAQASPDCAFAPAPRPPARRAAILPAGDRPALADVAGPAAAVRIGDLTLVDRDCAASAATAAEPADWAIAVAVRGAEVSVVLHGWPEDPADPVRARWNRPGRLVGRARDADRLRPELPVTPLDDWCVAALLLPGPPLDHGNCVRWAR